MERLTLDAHLSAAAMARHWVCDHCPDEHLPAARRWIAELLTSELVQNALDHGRAPVTLSLTHDDEGILVGITDGEGSGPRLLPQTPQAVDGRGIALVDALATAWGVYGSDDGVEGTDGSHGWPQPRDDAPAAKTVWFHLATR
ncbi:ATP-binding protein [Kineococcus rhizosphaerae]|uniref:ATP-binding protein n=1 Tax=Kineococcus rhizosphaerae TaxID=559628 RepID=UPI0011B2514A|nr:ATP-binding protein [Kineococcus rhizosphaerae]